jgi:hypothetical protein
VNAPPAQHCGIPFRLSGIAAPLSRGIEPANPSRLNTAKWTSSKTAANQRCHPVFCRDGRQNRAGRQEGFLPNTAIRFRRPQLCSAFVLHTRLNETSTVPQTTSVIRYRHVFSTVTQIIKSLTAIQSYQLHTFYHPKKTTPSTANTDGQHLHQRAPRPRHRVHQLGHRTRRQGSRDLPLPPRPELSPARSSRHLFHRRSRPDRLPPHRRCPRR